MSCCHTKAALSHDWLNGMRGGEKCLEVFCEMFPESPVFTLFYEPGKISEKIASHPIRASFLQKFPSVFKSYRNYLPLFPAAARSLDAREADIVISTSHCVAKGVRKKKGALHICYCFTPMRYAWLFFDEYFGKRGPVTRFLIGLVVRYLRAWDLGANREVDRFVAISKHVQNRIKAFYGRESEVIYPPADTDFFRPSSSMSREDFYLIVSALVPYKNVELAVRTFAKNGKRLVVVGDGPDRKMLEKTAGPNVTFVGWMPDEGLRDHYRRAKGLIFPGEEDFGIVPVEMQACGGAVIAFAKGGALETVIDGRTGVFFAQTTEASLDAAVREFELKRFEPRDARDNALRFSRDRFRSEVSEMINRELAARAA